MVTRKKTPKTDPTKAVAYLRVSTEDQHLGPEAQEHAIREWAGKQGITLVAIHTDKGVSGTAPVDRRPGLLAAITDLQGFAAGQLVVAKIDRIARDTFVHAIVNNLVNQVGARITSADGIGDGDGPEAVMRKGLEILFSQYERAKIAMRTSAALQAKRMRGERAGELPFGFSIAEDGKTLVPVPDEQEALTMAKKLKAEGMALRTIAAQLAAHGHRPRGKYWHPQTIARMVAA